MQPPQATVDGPLVISWGERPQRLCELPTISTLEPLDARQELRNSCPHGQEGDDQYTGFHGLTLAHPTGLSPRALSLPLTARRLRWTPTRGGERDCRGPRAPIWVSGGRV